MIKNFFQWLILSSADPEKVSLTIKGALASIAVYVVFFSGLIHINLTETDVSMVIEAIATLIEALLALVSAWTTLYGLIRKIGKTITGTNEVIAAQRAGSI